MKYLLIFNPGSHSGQSRRKLQRIQSLLLQQKIEVDYKITDSLLDAYRFSKEGNEVGYDIIIAVGGDGTINQVLNGFFNDQGKRLSPKTKMGVIYTGTSPDFCQNYCIPIETTKAIKTLINQFSRPIKVGKITYQQNFDSSLHNKPLLKANVTQTSYFACCANIGIGAALARAANSGFRKYLGDSGGTFLALLKTLTSYRPNDFNVYFDGKAAELKNLYNISIGKSFYIASGIKVNHDLKTNDLGFYNLVVQNITWQNLWKVLSIIYSGRKFINNETIYLNYFTTIEILGNNLNPEIEFDGDPVGFLPCRIEPSSDDLDLICEV